MDISGRPVFIVTRPNFVSRQRAMRLAIRAGGMPGSGTPRSGDIAVYGLGGAVGLIRRGGLLDQWRRLAERGVAPLSEIGFLRQVGLMPKVASTGLIQSDDFVRQSGLDPESVRILTAAGALEPVGDQFSFAELRLAREAARLLGRFYDLADIAEAAALAKRHDGAQIDAAGAELGVRLNAAGIEASGQTVLPFDLQAPLSEILDQAEAAEEAGDLPEARRLYEIAVMARPRDAIARYNLGCVLTALATLDKAEIHFRKAALLDPSFAEASYNVAHILRLKGDVDGERQFLEQSLAADPEYSDALVALARWFVARDAFAEVRRLLDRIEQVGVSAANDAFVRKAGLLCRLAEQA